MNSNKFVIIDDCRKKLLKYSIKAFSCIPKTDKPVILDIGCGTGVPTFALAENFSGTIYAVDSDKSSIDWLKEKVNKSKFNNRIKIIHASINEKYFFDISFDIILAEGFLNVIGFEKGLSILLAYLKNGGYIIIHDELKNSAQKMELFRKHHLTIIDSFRLDKNAWWNEYYSCLESNINVLSDKSLFKNEISEIRDYKKNPEPFQSKYYILQFIT